MEKELNIAAILKEKPDTKLWSPAIGECWFSSISLDGFVMVKADSVVNYWFSTDGRLFREGECLLFPSKQMQDWSKFAWKKGDVLIDRDFCTCIFHGWTTDEYTVFDAMYPCNEGKYGYSVKLPTMDFTKASDEEANEFIKELEEHYGGKLNLETLEIEKQPEFKDGNIVAFGKSVAIFRKIYDHTLYFYACIDETLDLMLDGNSVSVEPYRLATEEEKQQLFDALAKENKRWNLDTKQIEDLYKFKAFDKVIVRHDNDCFWSLDFFSHYGDEQHDTYQCLLDAYMQCLPYNEETAHLLGTTDEWK